MKAVELFSSFNNIQILGQSLDNKNIEYLVSDSRQVRENTCFIAVRGQRFDGHHAVSQVIDMGATVLVVDHFEEKWAQYEASFVVVKSTYRAQALLANYFYGQPTKKLNLVAITGTNGKTTTSSMISDWLMRLGHKTGLLGTMHYKVDQTYYPAINTTPDALRLQDLFHQMIDEDCEDAIIEASSHALFLGRLWYTDVNCAIFTNLTREHLDFHKTMEEYAYAKSLLFSQLGQSIVGNRQKLAILNMDDSAWQLMQQVTSAEIVTYSLTNTQADVYVSDIKLINGGSLFNLHFKGQIFPVHLKMMGQYNISNYLATFLCLVVYYGYSPKLVIETAMSFEGVEGRMQSINLSQEFQVVVDFAHTPDALRNVLDQLNRQKKGKLLALFGHSGGNRDSGARPELGDILFQSADSIVFTADNPRHEPVDQICQAMIGDHSEKPYIVIEDRYLAIKEILSMAKADDIVVFLGKGNEAYQVIGDEYQPYNEVETIKQAYSELESRD